MTDFNLNELIKSVEDAGPNAADMAAKAWPMIPESLRDSVGEMLLGRYIANMKPRLSKVAPLPTTKPVRSAKVRAYQIHAKFLRTSVNVGPGVDKWLGQCTYEDLCYAAENRRRHAAETIAAAEEFEALAALLKQQKVSEVGKLSDAALTEFRSRFGRAA